MLADTGMEVVLEMSFFSLMQTWDCLKKLPNTKDIFFWSLLEGLSLFKMEIYSRGIFSAPGFAVEPLKLLELANIQEPWSIVCQILYNIDRPTWSPR